MSRPDPSLRNRTDVLRTAMPLIIAALMLAVLLTPHTFWARAPQDGSYQGFDANLVKIDRRGRARFEGVVELSPALLRLAAIRESNPRVRLGSTPKDFNLQFDVKITQNDPGTTPLLITIWQWTTGGSYSLLFGPSPKNQIAARTVKGTKIVDEETIGRYELGESYRLEIVVDRHKKVVTTLLVGEETPPSGSNWVVLRNAAAHEPGYLELVSDMVPVREGEMYEFGGTMKLAYGYGNFKFSVFWFDERRVLLGWAPAVGWHPPKSLEGWTGIGFIATAPRNAAFATLVVSAENSTYFMTDLYLRATSNRGVNLLPNGRFQVGLQGWSPAGAGPDRSTARPDVRIPRREILASSIGLAKADLFPARLDVVWSMEALSSHGMSTAEVRNYRVLVPPQTWRGSSLWGVRVQDPVARRVVLWISAAAGLLMAIAIVRQFSGSARWMPPYRQHWTTHAWQSIWMRTAPYGLTVVASVLIFLVLNLSLFRLGYHLIDFNAARLWTYVGVRYGVAEIYGLTALLTTGEPWTGAALKHADFPYGPLMAYVFTGIGWLYRVFLVGPKGPNVEGVELGFLIKSVNLLFVLGGAVVLFKILRTTGLGRTPALLSAALYLFNPVVWFVHSIWGETHAVTILLLLLPILFCQRGQPRWAWISLAFGFLSRPQLWLPCLLLGLVCLRRFPLKENLRSMAWSTILVFMMLLPFSLHFGPSFLANWVGGVIDVQTPTRDVEGFIMSASLGAFNVWPLISPSRLGASGYDRMWFSSVEPALGSWTYAQISTLFVFGIQLVLMMLVLVTPRLARSNGRYILAVAVSLLALLLFRTGVSNHHFILVLPLLILTKGLVAGRAYWSAIAILTLTTFVSVVGDFAYHMQWPGIGDTLMPALFPGKNILMRFLLTLYQNDWIITLAAVSNLAVFLWLVWETARVVRSLRSASPRG